jgi:ABC-type phosphate transport system permease subunit
MAIITKAVFHGLVLFVSSEIHPSKKKKPNTITPISATWRAQNVADRDNEETAPVSMYDFGVVLFVVVQIIVVAALLIRRILAKK